MDFGGCFCLRAVRLMRNFESLFGSKDFGESGFANWSKLRDLNSCEFARGLTRCIDLIESSDDSDDSRGLGGVPTHTRATCT